MPISKKTRILLLIAVDAVFFGLEIVIGYTAHSLALVADAFHMLNDIISLCVGYWATDVAENRSSSTDYTYGWARAEILGGLINGVFLIALCVTIVLDAIQRFFEVQEVSNPKLVLIVGSIGLVFNIMGLFLFHQHDHGVGDEHDHSHDELGEAEAGHAHDHSGHAHSHSHDHAQTNGKIDTTTTKAGVRFKDSESAAADDESAPLLATTPSRQKRAHRRSNSRTYDSIENMPIHPASLRNDMRAQARMEDTSSESASEEEDEDAVEDDGTQKTNGLIRRNSGRRKSLRKSTRRRSSRNIDGVTSGGQENGAVDHHKHKHAQPKSGKSKSHGHSHDENIRGMFLHVLGDALGNVGVMASALIIWLSDWPYRFYFDPIISLFITLIILKSAIPLVRDTAKPLLQATPEDINVQDIQEDIESLPGIRSCHHVHVWALTRSKLIATLDVQLEFDFESKAGTKRWMDLAMEIKNCLHGFNIHNSTIQPEFCLNDHHAHAAGAKGVGHDGADDHDHDHDGHNHGDGADDHHGGHGGHDHAHGEHSHDDSSAAVKGQRACGYGEGECLLDDACGTAASQCCGPAAGSGTVTPQKSHAGHSH